MTRKIIVTRTDYPSGVPNGSVMTVTHESLGCVSATVDGGDSFPWHMQHGTFEYYPMKQEAPVTQGTPKTFGEMTPEEKGALLLGRHDGKTIEVASYKEGGKYLWCRCGWNHSWITSECYRVKPEPKVETVAHFLYVNGLKKITFTVTDGVVSTTVKVEEA